MWDWDLDDWKAFNERQQAWLKEINDSCKSPETLQREKEAEERKKLAAQNPPRAKVYNDPTGFIIYLLVMVVGVVFVDRWLIWIAATIIYFGSKK
jgi:hypothetical protein